MCTLKHFFTCRDQAWPDDAVDIGIKPAAGLKPRKLCVDEVNGQVQGEYKTHQKLQDAVRAMPQVRVVLRAFHNSKCGFEDNVFIYIFRRNCDQWLPEDSE